MNAVNCIDLSSITLNRVPFPHFYSTNALLDNKEAQVFNWFENTDEWNLTKTDFYEQYEFDFLNAKLPENLQALISEAAISKIEREFRKAFNVNALQLVGVVAHKLVHGHKIGIHNDFIHGDETHRLVLHISPDWKEENGGYLMLFNSSKANDISKIVNPLNNSAFGFEISNYSHHAVSKIYDFSRYTLVYTFKQV